MDPRKCNPNAQRGPTLPLLLDFCVCSMIGVDQFGRVDAPKTRLYFSSPARTTQPIGYWTYDDDGCPSLIPLPAPLQQDTHARIQPSTPHFHFQQHDARPDPRNARLVDQCLLRGAGTLPCRLLGGPCADACGQGKQAGESAGVERSGNNPTVCMHTRPRRLGTRDGSEVGCVVGLV